MVFFFTFSEEKLQDYSLKVETPWTETHIAHVVFPLIGFFSVQIWVLITWNILETSGCLHGTVVAADKENKRAILE